MTDLALGDIPQSVDQLQPPIFPTLEFPFILLFLQLWYPSHTLIHHPHDGFFKLTMFL